MVFCPPSVDPNRFVAGLGAPKRLDPPDGAPKRLLAGCVFVFVCPKRLVG